MHIPDQFDKGPKKMSDDLWWKTSFCIKLWHHFDDDIKSISIRNSEDSILSPSYWKIPNITIILLI